MLSVHTVKMKIILCVLVFTQYVAVVDGTCMQGYYGPNGRAPCTPCGAGTYNSQTGSTSCLNCGAGRYSSAGSGGCSACGAGTASATVTASGPSTCIKCLAGTWANGGASTCTNCLAGKYSTRSKHLLFARVSIVRQAHGVPLHQLRVTCVRRAHTVLQLEQLVKAHV
jgi:hypothetical protein